MNIALVLSGGTGTRLGSDIPKQYIEVGGRPVISYCLERLCGCSGIDAVHIVADRAWQGLVMECMQSWGVSAGSVLLEKFRGFSEPGGKQAAFYPKRTYGYQEVRGRYGLRADS